MATESTATLAARAHSIHRATYHKRSRGSRWVSIVHPALNRYGWSDGGGSYALAFSSDMTHGVASNGVGESWTLTLSPIVGGDAATIATIADEWSLCDGLSGCMADEYPELCPTARDADYIYVVQGVAYLAHF